MKTTQLESVAISKKMAVKFLGGSRTLLENGIKSGRIKPVIKGGRGKSSLYDVEEVSGFWNSLKSERGFTLVELLGVVGILAVIATLALVGIRGAIRASVEESWKTNARLLVEHADRARTLGYSEPWSDDGFVHSAIENAAERFMNGIETPVGSIKWVKAPLEPHEVHVWAPYIILESYGDTDRLIYTP